MTLRERLDVYKKLMRLHKPIGILLLMWPTLWGLWLSSYGIPNPGVLVIFVLGVILMRSAGCVVNDIADRNFDPHVERTRDRPLAAKKVSVAKAAALAGVLIALAFLLVVQLNRLTVVLSAVALFLALTYPLRTAARLTGLSPEVLRAWERRYGVVSPARTAGGTRATARPNLERLRGDEGGHQGRLGKGDCDCS